MYSKNNFYLLNWLQICCLALFIGCVNTECSENSIVKISEKISDTKFALIIALNSVAYGLLKYESENMFSAKFPTKMEGTMTENEFFQQITSENLTLLLKLADHLKEDEKAGKKTRIRQNELVDCLEKQLKENSQKAGVKRSEHFLLNAKVKFELYKPQRAEESTQLLVFYHYFLWEIRANLEEEEKFSLKTANECTVLKHLTQQKMDIADRINDGLVAFIKRRLLNGIASSVEGIDFRNVLNVAIQASVLHFVKDRQKRREIDMSCLPFKSPNMCFLFSTTSLVNALWKLSDEEMAAAKPEELLHEMETEMAKWLQGDILTFLFGALNGRVKSDLASLHAVHWNSDKERRSFFSVLFIFARFYRHLAEEIWRRYVQNPQTVEFADLETAESMERFVREKLARNEQIFLLESEQEKEQKHLHMKLMVVGPEIVETLRIKREKLSQSVSEKFVRHFGKTTYSLRDIYQLDENRHFCKKLSAVVISWIFAWELRTTNVAAELEMMEDFEQKMNKWSEETDKSQCIQGVRKFCKLAKIVKQGGMNKRNVKFISQILDKGIDAANVKLDFTSFFAANEFYIKVARLLTELQEQRLADDSIEAETLAILDEINRVEEKLLQKFLIKDEGRAKISEFLKMFASAIDYFESRIFHLKMAKQFGDEWRTEQKNCLNKLIGILARIVKLTRSVLHYNYKELRAELGYLVNELAVLKATIQRTFPSKIFAAKELLKSAVRIREAFENYSLEKSFAMEKELAKEYNEFARCLERMEIDGLQRDMSGYLDLETLEKVVKKSETNTGLDAKILELAIELLHVHKQLDVKHLAMVKIRGVGHMNISVGSIEYDFTMDGPRRRKFREGVAELTSVLSPAFSIPMAQWGMVEVSKADKVFYKMVQAGWHNGNYDNKDRDCRAFAYIFICRLFDWKCPSPETWPKNFVDLDRTYEATNSVFTMASQLIANDHKEQANKNGHCELKEHRFEFQIQFELPGEAGDNQKQMPMSMEKMLPPIVQYQTGEFAGFDATKRKVRLENVLTLVQVDARELAGKQGQTFEATLMAYTCTTSTALFDFFSREKAFVRKFRLRDRTNSIEFKTTGFPKEFDLLVRKKLPIIRIIGLGTEESEEEGDEN